MDDSNKREFAAPAAPFPRPSWEAQPGEGAPSGPLGGPDTAPAGSGPLRYPWDGMGAPQAPEAPAWVARAALGRGGGNRRYPFGDLEVGGTFTVPPEEQRTKYGSFQTLCRTNSKNHGRKYLCHSYEEGEDPRYPAGTWMVYRQA